MPFYDDDEMLRTEFERLPQDIKSDINISDEKITSCEELTELARRIMTVKWNKLP